MADVSPAPKAKTTKPAAETAELPKIESPKAVAFDGPALEVPAAFREIAEKGLAQAKESYAKARAVAEDTTGILENTYANAAKGASDYGLKVIEIARANANTAFDFLGKVVAAKSLSELIELSTAQAREQFEASTEQLKELTALAQKVAAETAEPIKSGVSSALHKAA